MEKKKNGPLRTGKEWVTGVDKTRTDITAFTFNPPTGSTYAPLHETVVVT